MQWCIYGRWYCPTRWTHFVHNFIYHRGGKYTWRMQRGYGVPEDSRNGSSGTNFNYATDQFRIWTYPYWLIDWLLSQHTLFVKVPLAERYRAAGALLHPDPRDVTRYDVRRYGGINNQESIYLRGQASQVGPRDGTTFGVVLTPWVLVYLVFVLLVSVLWILNIIFK